MSIISFNSIFALSSLWEQYAPGNFRTIKTLRNNRQSVQPGHNNTHYTPGTVQNAEEKEMAEWRSIGRRKLANACREEQNTESVKRVSNSSEMVAMFSSDAAAWFCAGEEIIASSCIGTKCCVENIFVCVVTRGLVRGRVWKVKSSRVWNFITGCQSRTEEAAASVGCSLVVVP